MHVRTLGIQARREWRVPDMDTKWALPMQAVPSDGQASRAQAGAVQAVEGS